MCRLSEGKIFQALSGLDIKYYHNPFFEITNSIASLWFARDELQGDVLIINADVYFSQEVLQLILSDVRENVMAIDTSRVEVGDYFFSTTDNGCIRKYGKDLPVEERSCEYVGIAKVNKNFIATFKSQLERMIDNQQHQCWWENVLYSFTDTNKHQINTIDVDGLFWSEIDFFDDYERILNYINKKES